MIRTVNIRLAGLGGMGILKAAELLAEALFRGGYDVKKAEVHGMSQRGGSVTSDVRFGRDVLSPMIPDGEVDFLVVVAPGELDAHRPNLRPGGAILSAAAFDPHALPSRHSLNVALLGALSRHLDLPAALWTETLRAVFPERAHADNLRAFDLGRQRAAQGPLA